MDQLVQQVIQQEPDLMAAEPQTVDCSIVVPVFDEEENIGLLHERVCASMDPTGVRYEVIYVDDGSRDSSPQRLTEIAESDGRVTYVQFRRNFGQTAAIAAGIEISRGEIIVFMDADLQNDPADIPRLLDKINEGYDVVSGWRVNRQDAALTRKLPSVVANRLISIVTGVRLHDYGCTLKAYRREVVTQINLYGEMHRFIPAHAAWVGASIAEVPVRHHPRIHGRSKYGLARTGKVALDLLTVKFLGSYSTKPIYVFGGLGLASIILSFLSIFIAILDKLINGVSLIQSPLLLLAAMLFIVGVQLILMGFLAELAVRTYHESQAKPTYVIRRVVRKKGRAPR